MRARRGVATPADGEHGPRLLRCSQSVERLNALRFTRTGRLSMWSRQPAQPRARPPRDGGHRQRAPGDDHADQRQREPDVRPRLSGDAHTPLLPIDIAHGEGSDIAG
jgi:hypothetical protein